MLDKSGRFCRNTAVQSKRLKYVTVPSWIVFLKRHKNRRVIMKNMASLMKIELILMKRQAAYYLLSIGLPSVFYLILMASEQNISP